jgi:hypothetical protein
LLQSVEARVTPERISRTPKDWIAESRWTRKMKANSIVDTAHRFIVAATIGTLPI